MSRIASTLGPRALAMLLLAVSVSAQPPNAAGWKTSGRRILDASGRPVRINGLNWFGLESENFAPHGLWKRSYKDMMSQMKSLGYNTIRLTFSNQTFERGSRTKGIDRNLNPDLQDLSPIEVMDRIVAHAEKIGMKILLDRHRISSTEQAALWYTDEYPEQRWIADWEMLADRYRSSPAVIGADLHNEPHLPSCWGCGDEKLDWRLAAQRAGNAILARNPSWLIVVEGGETFQGKNYFWGGNLMGARRFPVVLSVPNRLVYSAHDYPASIHKHPWFSAADYPANLPEVWTSYWGYLAKENIAPVLIGEFGSRLETDLDRQWFDSIVQYIGTGPDGLHWIFWSWNPNSADTGGLLLDDWLSIDTRKHNKLKTIQFLPGAAGSADQPTSIASTPPPSAAPVNTPPPAPAAVRVQRQQPVTAGPAPSCTVSVKVLSDWGDGYNAHVSIFNKGKTELQGWVANFKLPERQRIKELWNANYVQKGRDVSARSLDWNGGIPPGQPLDFNFVVEQSSSGAKPHGFQLNGTPCQLNSQ